MEQEYGESERLDERLETEQATSALASCFWCERLHPSEHALSVCPACTARYSTVEALEMSGAYPLSDEAIDQMPTRTSPGNYALGYMDGSTFNVFYVGRSDSDLKRRLYEWVGAPSRSGRYGSSGKAAWSLRPSACMPLGTPALGPVGNAAGSSYTHFAYSYSRSPDAAFGKEWRNYEEFGGHGQLDNETQPRRSAAYHSYGREARPDEAA